MRKLAKEHVLTARASAAAGPPAAMFSTPAKAPADGGGAAGTLGVAFGNAPLLLHSALKNAEREPGSTLREGLVNSVLKTGLGA